MLELMTEKNVVPESHYSDFTGQWIILDPTKYMKEDYCNSKNQLFRATSGFGCDPNKTGRKIFGIFASDFDTGYIVIREEVIGVATPEAIEKWKAAYPELANHIEKIEKGEF